jgi:hypothetical protein
MPFLNPWLLLLTGAAGIPVAIHLLNRHQPKVIRWGAMELLQRVVRVQARQIRLQDILLMILRCLAILLLVLALARPTTQIGGLTSSSDVGVVLAIDTSASMNYQASLESRFEAALARARDISTNIASGRPFTLVAVGQSPHIVQRNVLFNRTRFEEALAGIQPTEGRGNLARSLEALHELVDELKAPQREIYWITDAQQHDFSSLSPAVLDRLETLGEKARLFLVASDPKGQQNIALTDFTFASGLLRTGQLARYMATVTNFSDQPRDAGEVGLWVNDVEVDRQYLGTIEAGDTRVVPLFTSWANAGAKKVTAQLNEDSLRLDNIRRGVADIRPTLRLLCVDGGSAGSKSGSALEFLLPSLLPRMDIAAQTGLELSIASWLDMEAEQFSQYDVILLANVAELSEETAKDLRRFVAGGGGLMIFLGENIKAESWNRQLRQANGKILPAELQPSPRVLDTEKAYPISELIPSHPAVDALGMLGPQRLTATQFEHVVDVTPDPQSRVLLRLAAVDKPLLIEKQFGQGKVLLFTSSADRTWNNLAITPVLPLLLHQSVTYLASRPWETPLVVGQSVTLPLPEGRDDQPVLLRGPKGEESRISPERQEGELVVELPALNSAGFYQVSLRPDADPLPLAVNIDPAESDIRTISPGDLSQSLPEEAGRVIGENDNLDVIIKEGRVGKELWLHFLLAAVAVLVLEGFLARRFTHRKTAGTTETLHDKSKEVAA